MSFDIYIGYNKAVEQKKTFQICVYKSLNSPLYFNRTLSLTSHGHRESLAQSTMHFDSPQKSTICSTEQQILLTLFVVDSLENNKDAIPHKVTTKQ